MAGKDYQRDGHLSGIATGLRELDKLMGGLQRSDLIILAGRPAMGKTALATNIAYKVTAAFEGQFGVDGFERTIDGGKVMFFSLEMSSEQLATRILSEQAEVASILDRAFVASAPNQKWIADFTYILTAQG